MRGCFILYHGFYKARTSCLGIPSLKTFYNASGRVTGAGEEHVGGMQNLMPLVWFAEKWLISFLGAMKLTSDPNLLALVAAHHAV